MLAKACGVFCGYSKGDFEDKDGVTVDWCNAAFSVPGSADTYTLKVNLKEVDPELLVEYEPNYLLLDFRYNASAKSWRGYIVDVFPDEEAMEAYELPDPIPENIRKKIEARKLAFAKAVAAQAASAKKEA